MSEQLVFWKLPHPLGFDLSFQCKTCDTHGLVEELPTFCPRCGSVYVLEAHADEDADDDSGDREPIDDDEDEEVA